LQLGPLNNEGGKEREEAGERGKKNGEQSYLKKEKKMRERFPLPGHSIKGVSL